MTFSINLSGTPLISLQEQASRLGVPIETLAQSVIENFASSQPSTMSPQDRRALFEKAKADSMRENDELYRRLAQ
ncbi:hypothetical protein BH11PLA2_BH11PLA2_42720 [soil metagenome]